LAYAYCGNFSAQLHIIATDSAKADTWQNEVLAFGAISSALMRLNSDVHAAKMLRHLPHGAAHRASQAKSQTKTHAGTHDA
jgi:hypothetical protein